jgi:hypothetical protein
MQIDDQNKQQYIENDVVNSFSLFLSYAHENNECKKFVRSLSQHAY